MRKESGNELDRIAAEFGKKLHTDSRAEMRRTMRGPLKRLKRRVMIDPLSERLSRDEAIELFACEMFAIGAIWRSSLNEN